MPLYSDVEAEELFLGALLHDPGMVVSYAHILDPGEFTARKNAIAWQGACELLEQRTLPSAEELEFHLAKRQKHGKTLLELIGGREYLDGLMRSFTDKGFVETSKAGLWVERVQDASERTLMAQIASDLASAAERIGIDADETWGELLYSVLDKRKRGRQRWYQELKGYRAELETESEQWWSGIAAGRLATGFAQLDEQLGGGLPNRKLIILGGTPGSFKTALMEQVTIYIASEVGQAVAWSSIEMAGPDLLLRMACRESRVELRKLTAGLYSVATEDVGKRIQNLELKKRFDSKMAWLCTLPIHVDQSGDVTTAMIYYRALLLSAQHDIRLLVVDFAELVADKEPEGETIRVAQIFRRSKNIAKLLNIPAVVLSQVTKEVEKTRAKKPQAHAIRYAGHDVADYVLLMYDPWGYLITGDMREKDVPTAIDADENKIYVIIGKSRFGSKGLVELNVQREFGLISDPLSPMKPPKRGF